MSGRSTSSPYDDIKAAKEKDIKVGQHQTYAKTLELASTDEKLAESEGGVEDTQKSSAADEEFLAMLKEKFSGTDAER